MKSITIIAIAFFLSCSIVSCKHKNQIRVKNSFSKAVTVLVGPADFGSVPSVKTTEYKDIPKGKQEITGDITGAITVPKNGKHKYTLLINTVGIVSLIEEKS